MFDLATLSYCTEDKSRKIKITALYFGKYSKFRKHIYIVKTKIFHTFF
ncbi:hypothetical protein BpHYR1_040431 [Brachionus plicatilis]|uniref:Uncharacterized protein n=1 Tax=Brachionus plicatilis TaxID=10195 RepID=A0A3M7RL99_BRAPC|nr:hypothetical protein BpHYR1_040431 [Brachionus plicatilis]